MINNSDLASEKKIARLPDFVIDQIKAGEVVDSPTSLLKELIENSLDAGAKNISLQLSEDFISQIVIEDDGCGIAFEDLELAFKRHTTSKLTSLADIYGLSSYGFRGEALASAAAVSRIKCISQGLIEIEGGEVVLHKTTPSLSRGTSLKISDLFYNTPARLKFLRAKRGEKRKIKKMLGAFLLARPEVSFSINFEGEKRDSLSYPPENSIENRFLRLCQFDSTPRSGGSIGRGRASASASGSASENVKEGETAGQGQRKFISLSGNYEGSKIEIAIGSAPLRGSPANSQYLLVNGRPFEDRHFHYLLINTLKNSVWRDFSSAYLLQISCPPSEIDVNVHPHKTEVKFLKRQVLASLIHHELSKLKCVFRERSFNIREGLASKRGPEEWPKECPEEDKEVNESFEEKIEKSYEQKFYPLQIFSPFIALYYKNWKEVSLVQISPILEKFYFDQLGQMDLNGPGELEMCPLLICDVLELELAVEKQKQVEIEKDFFLKTAIEIEFFDDKSFLIKAFPRKAQSLVEKGLLKLFCAAMLTKFYSISTLLEGPPHRFSETQAQELFGAEYHEYLHPLKNFKLPH